VLEMVRRSDCGIGGRWELRGQKKRVIVSSTIRSNILFTLQQTIIGISDQEWGGPDNYSKRGNYEKYITFFN